VRVGGAANKQPGSAAAMMSVRIQPVGFTGAANVQPTSHA
jgi:hypothetical protein